MMMTVENLLYGMEKGSFIDLKLGTSTLTSDKEGRFYLETTRKMLDNLWTCSGEHGFTICGMNLMDPETGAKRHTDIYPDGKVGKKNPPNNIEEAEQYLTHFFSSEKEGKVDMEAIEYCRQELIPMLKYFKEENEHIIRGMSLFIVIDSHQKKYKVKLIDFVSIEKIPEG